MLRPRAAEPAHELRELGSFLEQRLETHQELGDGPVGEPAHRRGASDLLELVRLQIPAMGSASERVVVDARHLTFDRSQIWYVRAARRERLPPRTPVA